MKLREDIKADVARLLVGCDSRTVVNHLASYVEAERDAVLDEQRKQRPSFTNKELAELIAKSLRGLSPHEASARLSGGFLCHLLARIPEDQWRGMLNDSPVPCGVAECHCEGLRTQVMEALNALREDFRTQVQSYGGQT